MKSDEEAQKAIHNKHKSKYSDENPPLQNPFFLCVCVSCHDSRDPLRGLNWQGMCYFMEEEEG